jgi:hypothetical protein
MAASLTGTLRTLLGHRTPGGHIAVAMIGRPSLSWPVTPRRRPGTSTARRFSRWQEREAAGAARGGRQS